MDRYADRGMNLLSDSLSATNVLSSEYKRLVEGYALMAIGEAYERGIAEGKKRGTEETDDWKQVQNELRQDVYGDWTEIRGLIGARHAEQHPDEGLTSSDINHIAYGMVKAGDLLKMIEFLSDEEKA